MTDMTPRSTERATALAKTLQREMAKIDLEGPPPTHTQCLTAIAAASGFDTLFDYQRAVKAGAQLPPWDQKRLLGSIERLGHARDAQRTAVVDAVEAVAASRKVDPLRQLLGEVSSTMGSHDPDSFDVARMLAREKARAKARAVLETLPEGTSLVEWDMGEFDDFDDEGEHAEEYHDLIGDMLGGAPDDGPAFEAWRTEIDRTLALVVARDAAGLEAHPSAAVSAASDELASTENQRRRAIARAVLDNAGILLTSNRHGVESPIGPVSVCYQIRDTGGSDPEEGGPRTCIGFMTVTDADGSVAGILRTEHTILWDDDGPVHARDVFWEMDSHSANEVYKAILNDHLPAAGHRPDKQGMQDWIEQMAVDNLHIVVADPGVIEPKRGRRLAEWMTRRMCEEIDAAIFRSDPDADSQQDDDIDFNLHAVLGFPGLVVFSVTGSPWESGSSGADPRTTDKLPPATRNDRDERRKAGLNRYVASMGPIGDADVLVYDLYDYPSEFHVP